MGDFSCFQRRQWHPNPALLAGKSHGWRSLEGCSPWGREESDTTERLHFHFSLSCIGEGNGNPLQCSCLESSRDGGAWWAAIYGVAQSQTRLKQLSRKLLYIDWHARHVWPQFCLYFMLCLFFIFTSFLFFFSLFLGKVLLQFRQPYISSYYLHQFRNSSLTFFSTCF